MLTTAHLGIDNRPSLNGNIHPLTNNGQPAMDNQQRTTDNRKPTTENGQPKTQRKRGVPTDLRSRLHPSLRETPLRGSTGGNVRQVRRLKDAATSDNRQPTPGNGKPTTDNRQRTTENRKPTTENGQRITDNRQPTPQRKRGVPTDLRSRLHPSLRETPLRGSTGGNAQQVRRLKDAATSDNRQPTLGNGKPTTENRQRTPQRKRGVPTDLRSRLHPSLRETPLRGSTGGNVQQVRRIKDTAILDDSQPTTDNGKRITDNRQLTTENRKPTPGNGKPTTDNRQPTTQRKRGVPTDLRSRLHPSLRETPLRGSTGGNVRQVRRLKDAATSDDRQPTPGNGKPTTDNGKPTTDNPQPFSNPQPLPFLLLPFFLLVPFLSSSLFAQQTLTLEEALNWALTNHPVADMAAAVEAQGAAALLRSKGAFDPKIAGDFDRKQYLGTEYFNYGNAGVEWQSPYAIKVMGGYEFADGVYLNDERFLSSGEQAYLAVKLPLLQGLITDAARIDRRRGDVAVERQRALANVIRNELRYDLSTRYAEWRFTERALQINQETEALLELYLDQTRELFRQGDKPAVDTLEASVYLGTQRLATRQAAVDAQLAALAFSEIYWPLEPGVLPAAIPGELLDLPAQVDWPMTQPELLDLQLLVTDYQLQQRLKREKLKPKLDVSYYLLGDGLELPAQGEGVGGFFDRAYKVGATASYPIFNRKARGEVEEGRLKIVEGEAKLAGKQQSLNVKADAYRNALTAYVEQLDDSETLVTQSEALLAAERELFRLGESTQFLLNVRQQNLQKSMLVREKIRFSRNKAMLGWRMTTAVW